MIHDGQVCASVPTETYSVAVHWCEKHQAFVITAYGYRYTGPDEQALVWTPKAVEMGPFDTMALLEQEILEMAGRMSANLIARHAAPQVSPANPQT